MQDKKITAIDVKRAIAKRHREDMFFTEVKDGPTQIVAHHSKIDALAIKIGGTDFAGKCLESIEQLKSSGGFTTSIIQKIQHINALSGALAKEIAP